MTSPPQLRLGLGDEPPQPPEDAPLIYIASPLTHLDQDGRDAVLALGDIIESALRETTLEASEPWAVRVHLPAKLSPPWNEDGRQPAQIFELNSEMLWTHADALILVAHRGGSLGAGQEVEWARGRGIPVLYLHRTSEPVSRQVRGTPGDITIQPFGTPADIRDAVARFVRTRRPTLEDGPRRGSSLALRFTVLAVQLRSEWQQCGSVRRREIVALTGFPEQFIDRLVRQPLALAAIPLSRVDALASALHIEIARTNVTLPHLTVAEMRALVAAQAEYGWDDAVTDDLASAGRAELARGGVRRLGFTTIEAWLRLHEHRGHA